MGKSLASSASAMLPCLQRVLWRLLGGSMHIWSSAQQADWRTCCGHFLLNNRGALLYASSSALHGFAQPKYASDARIPLGLHTPTKAIIIRLRGL